MGTWLLLRAAGLERVGSIAVSEAARLDEFVPRDLIAGMPVWKAEYTRVPEELLLGQDRDGAFKL